ncbi:MAG: archaellin/type IV pilin N-terminal domain-containing protein [Candidatus Altiarchaeota archaeon]
MRKTASKGMMGIGTLIIFIAVILVAAVAASVLISTAGSLQQKALVTGGQTEEGVATGVEAVSVTATDGTTTHDVEQFEFIVRLQAGSESLNLNNTVLMVDTSALTWSMDYSGSATEWDVSSTTGRFGVEYVKRGSDYEEGYLSRGDVIKLHFNTSAGVSENEKVRLKIIPRVGQATIVEFTTPDVMNDNRVNLWP